MGMNSDEGFSFSGAPAGFPDQLITCWMRHPEDFVGIGDDAWIDLASAIPPSGVAPSGETTRAHEFESRCDGSRCLAWDRMFSASTSSRFKENSTDAPGPGAYNTSNNWEDASGPGVLASKSDRFANRGALLNPPPRVAPLALTGRAYRYPESIAPGPGHYGGAPAVGPLATAGSVRAGGRRLSARPPAAPTDDTKLDRTLGDLKESLRVLRLSATAVSPVVEGAEEVAKLREHLQGDKASVRVQDECITLCENALRVQEEAVAILPSLLHKEREHAAASRERAAENAERAATLQARSLGLRVRG